MKRFLLIYFLALTSLFPQAGRPPVTNLNGLSDVTLTSPANGDALIYNSGTSQWVNSVIPGGALSALTDVTIVTPLDNQLLKYSSAASKWSNYGPLAFSDLTGNIVVSQMASGAGASASSYWRGDGTWASPPTGAIAPVTNLLVGDGAGNAIDAASGGLTLGATGLVQALNGNFINVLQISNTDSTGGDTLVQARVNLTTASSGLLLSSLGPNFVTSGIFSANDATIQTQTVGDLVLAVPTSTYALKFSNDGGTTQRFSVGSGATVGPAGTVDKGAGTVNVSGGYYINGTAIATSAPVAKVTLLTAASGAYATTTGARALFVECIAAGGGGGGATAAASNTTAGGGGASGSYAASYITGTLQASYNYVIGVGGTAGASAGTGTGGTGGNTTWAATMIVAVGGAGGAGSNVTGAPAVKGAGGVGAVPTAGDIRMPGSDGMAGFSLATTGSTSLGGGGGGAPRGGGSSQHGFAQSAGANGNNYGGGGSGAVSNTATGFAGGVGAQGCIIVTEYY
jgi:hypothetical protein